MRSNSATVIREQMIKYSILKNKIAYLNYPDKNAINFVQYIEETLKMFKDYEQKFIFNVYVNRMNYLEINYSRSSYYYLKNKLDTILFEALKNINF